jgi:probable rRNA maturation factor
MSLTVHVNGGGIPTRLRALLRRAVRDTLRGEGISNGELSLTFLDDPSIRDLNREWLGHDRVTDVISFALRGEGPPTPAAPLLGDVYVGREQALRQAAEAGVPLEEELVRLAVHGVLHVCGHDHPEGSERIASPMFRLQEERVAAILGASRSASEPTAGGER